MHGTKGSTRSFVCRAAAPKTSQVKALEMDARERRSFLEEAQRHVASGRRVDALVDVYFEGDGVCIEEDAAGGCTRLHYAAYRGWCAAITWLLEQGANVHVGWPSGRVTPLHGAATCDRREAAVLLLDAGARVDDRNRYRLTALHQAACNGDIDMCKLLLSRGASLDVRANNGDDPEAIARRYGRTATADVLAAVRAAGGWAAYARAPRVQLLMLRILCEQGRAVAPPGLLARLFPRPFPCETERRASLRSARNAPAALPKELFWHIAQFWRSDRDSRY